MANLFSQAGFDGKPVTTPSKIWLIHIRHCTFYASVGGTDAPPNWRSAYVKVPVSQSVLCLTLRHGTVILRKYMQGYAPRFLGAVRSLEWQVVC